MAVGTGAGRHQDSGEEAVKEGLAALWALPGSEQATGLRGPATAGTEEQGTSAAFGQQERGGRKGQTLPARWQQVTT